MGLSGAWLLSRASKALMPSKSNGLPVSRKPSPCTLIERFLFQRWSHVCEQRSSRHRQEITSYKTLNIFEYVKEVQAGRSTRDFSNAGLTSIDQFTSRHRVEHSMFNWHRKEGKTMQDMSLAADRFNAVMLRENHILSVDVVFVGWQAGKQKSSKLSGSLQDQGSCLYVKFAAHCRCRHRFWRGPSADVRHQTIWPCWILCRQIIDDPLRTWWILHR